MFGAESAMFFDRTVVLTAATEGLGPDLAARLVARGARVIAIDRRTTAVRALAASLGGGVTVLARDLAEPAAPVEIARWIADEHRDLAALICNATACQPDRSALAPDETQRQVFAPVALAGLVWPFLQRNARLVLALSSESADLFTGFEALATRLHDHAWDTGRANGITTATLAPERLTATPQERRKLAEAILDAAEAGKAGLRRGSRWSGRMRGLLPRAGRAAGTPA